MAAGACVPPSGVAPADAGVAFSTERDEPNAATGGSDPIGSDPIGSDPIDDGSAAVGGADAGPLWEGQVRTERSLAWTNPELLDDPATIGLGRVLGAVAGALGTTPGAALDAWLRRFATTPHSERASPARLAEQLAHALGDDVNAWDVDLAPFRVTGVHNRIDLMHDEHDEHDDPHCGELRVSLASTDALIRPFHALFIFRQPARDDDWSADGALSCVATALRWAQLSDLEDEEFITTARALLTEGIVPERFVMVETVELTVSPWEWRQWVPTATASGMALDNPPLFQQLDVNMLNAPGPQRTAFLTFVEDNAAALDARTLLVPEVFRPRVVRVAQGVPRPPLNLEGLPPAVREAYPKLGPHLEIVGCVACHTADAPFVQTREDRTLSPFYTQELLARAALLGDLLRWRAREIPYGPLQEQPVLPPG